ncbi:MAG: hypothetical protein H0Z28_04515 [Archaeoglobus sp.]|nr:hypothetical protein [Archaeoglobus sp.]
MAMYSKKRTLSQRITLTNRKIDLPRDAVIDAIMLYCKLTLKNNDGANAFSGKMRDVLDALKEVRVVSDGNNIHYSLSGSDIAVINYYDNQGKAVNVDADVSIDAGATKEFDFLLILDAGDILALTKDSLELSVDFEDAIDDSGNVTVEDAEIKITIEENVFTVAEFANTYGANLELAAEPKIYAREKKFSASNELVEVMELPVGTLLRKAFITFRDSNGEESDSLVEKYGIIITTPDRRELYTIDYNTAKEYQKLMFLADPITGTVVLDYGAEITNDVYGVRAWKFNKGDYQLALKANAEGTLRYVSYEFVVNTKVMDAVDKAVIEAS